MWPGALLVDGEIVGTWRRAKRTFTIKTWKRLSRSAREAVVAEAEALPLPTPARPSSSYMVRRDEAASNIWPARRLFRKHKIPPCGPFAYGPGRGRTCDLGIKSPLLYQLSYRPFTAEYALLMGKGYAEGSAVEERLAAMEPAATI